MRMVCFIWQINYNILVLQLIRRTTKATSKVNSSSDKDKIIEAQAELIKNLQKQVKEWEDWKASSKERHAKGKAYIIYFPLDELIVYGFHRFFWISLLNPGVDFETGFSQVPTCFLFHTFPLSSPGGRNLYRYISILMLLGG